MKETVEMPLGSNPAPPNYHPLLPSPTSPTNWKKAGRVASRPQSRHHEDRQQRSRNPAESRPRFRDDLESQREAEDDTEELYHQQESVSPSVKRREKPLSLGRDLNLIACARVCD
jgi:hypothetical protein